MILRSLVAILLLCAVPAAADEGVTAPGRPSLVIFNLRSDFDDGDVGGRVGYALRAKLRRSERFTIPDELDFDDIDSDGGERPGPGGLARARELAAPYEPRYLVWGEVTSDGGYHIHVEAIDLGGDGEAAAFEKDVEGFRQLALACGELADEIAERLTGEGCREVYPSKSTEGWRRVGENLVANGDFEKGDVSPEGWDRVDGLCSFWDSDAEHGRFVRMDSDVYLAEWQAWRGRFNAGAPASDAPSKTPTSGPKYDTVAGTYGVKFYSVPIPVKPGATYSIEFDARGRKDGPLFFPKVFVKGYGEGGPSEELYRMYKAVKPESPDRWEHFSRVFSPTERTPGVKYMRVMIMAYWPPGEYAFDNVEIFEVVREDKATDAE